MHKVCDTQQGVGGMGLGRHRGTIKWEHLGDEWPLIKYASRLVSIMSMIICMIVVIKCNKKFVHSYTSFSLCDSRGFIYFIFKGGGG